VLLILVLVVAASSPGYPVSLITPYVHQADMSSINEAFNVGDCNPWGFTWDHRGIDFFPTVCDVVGVPLPSDRPIDGRSLAPLLAGARDLGREAIFWHFPHYRGRDVVPYSIVRAGDWKLIKRYEGRTFELFDLAADLGETTDLSEERPDKVAELDARLRAWLLDTGARMPRENPDYEGEA
jgi:arylsulfatase A-like enzyme